MRPEPHSEANRHSAAIKGDLDMERLANALVEPYESDPTMGRCRVCGEDGAVVGRIEDPDAILAEYRLAAEGTKQG